MLREAAKCGFNTGVSAVALLAGLAALPAQAQTAPGPVGATPADVPATDAPQKAPTAPQEADNPQSDIVVTALKSGQSVQRTPATVIIASGDTISSAAITSADQLTRILPGVQLQAPSPGLFTATVRGLSSSPSNNSFEQTVGLFVDGIFAGHPRDYTAALFDIDHVELLKGTQAAVLGKNTSVGAISLSTTRPSKQFGYEGSFIQEFALDSSIANLAVNVPLSDTLSVRVAGIYSNQGGWINYRLLGDQRYPRTRTRGIRASLRWTPTDWIDWTVYAQLSDNKVTGNSLVIGGDTLGRARNAATFLGYTDFKIGGYSTDETGRPGFVFDGKTSPISFDDSNAQRYYSRLEFDLGGPTLTARTGYSKYDDAYLLTYGLPTQPLLRTQAENNQSFSQELQLVSPTSGLIRYVAGAYYYNDRWQVNQVTDNLPLPTLTTAGAEGNLYTQKVESISGYGQLTIAPTEGLELIGGARYDQQHKEGSFVRTILRAGGITNGLPAYAPATLTRNEGHFSYSVQAKYEFSPRMIVYAGYFTGGKAGGFQSVPTNPQTAAYNPEKSKTAAIGAKIGIFRGGHINVELFNTDIDNFQFAYNTGTVFLVRNDFIRSRGADIDIDLPLAKNFDLTAAVTYADVKKTKPVAGANDSLPWAPKWSGIVGAKYNRSVSDVLDVSFDLNAQFRTKEYLNDALSFPMQFSPGFVKLNARLALADMDRGIEVAVFARNLTDERVVSYAVPIALSGAFYTVLDPPRTIGLELKVKR